MKRNTKAKDRSSIITEAEKRYKAKEGNLYDEMMKPINDAHPANMTITIEELDSKGWQNETLKEIVIKEMAKKGWGWRAGSISGKSKNFEFVFIGMSSYKGPGIPSVLMQPVEA